MESPMVGTFMTILAKQMGVWVEMNRRLGTALLSIRGTDVEHNLCIIVFIIRTDSNDEHYEEPRAL